MTRFAALAAIGPLLVACNPVATAPADPDPSLDVITETSATEFELGDTGALVPFTVRNASSETTYFVFGCGDRIAAGADRRERSRWIPYQSGHCVASLQWHAFVLEPGQSLESASSLREAGEYRLRLRVSDRVGGSGEWGETSNSFVVR